MPRETPYPSYQDDYADEDKILDFPSTSGQNYARWKTYFCPQSTKHPAKANLAMISWIIDTYTKPGDVVVDPMAGTGSTCVVAMRKGRHAIAGEYEWRYVFSFLLHNMNQARIIGSFEEIGQGYVVIGDSRKLSTSIPKALKLMGLEDRIVTTTMFSPPYVGLHIKKEFRGGKDEVEQWAAFMSKLDGRSIKAAKKNIARWQDYGSDPDNIANMPQGSADMVVTSPPYSSILSSAAGGQDDETKVRKVLLQKGHSPKQIDKIISSSTSSAYHLTESGRGYTDDRSGVDKANIGNMPTGSADSVVTSPPYADMVIRKSGTRNVDFSVPDSERIDGKGYSRDPDNIGNLPMGVADQTITSPPYSEALSIKAGGGSRDVFHGKGIIGRGAAGKSPVPYSEDEDQIGNLKHGSADQVITSPPYEGSLEHRGGNQELGTAKGMTPYTTDKKNIGNMTQDTYMQAMYDLYQDAWRYTKFGGLLILIVKNFARHKAPVDLASDTIQLAEMAGWLLMDRHYFRLPDKSFWIIQHTKKFAKRLYMKVNGVPGVKPKAPVNPCDKLISTKIDGVRVWSDLDVIATGAVTRTEVSKWVKKFDRWAAKYPKMFTKHLLAFRDTNISKVKINEGEIIHWFRENGCTHPWADYEDILVFVKPSYKMINTLLANKVLLPEIWSDQIVAE